ncbi:TRAP transporter small permease subunit [Pseudooceanicola sp. 216_PA32_1]|uniref:TRAP transporter small permease protein n=1 Tax=Pseudooceanicola pacificus TaxID=2676438 RepID=A0A844W1L2_9RHOB|nr:TRAP transporter small permease subunit [Pseudooceanicola pacificus]MWB78016.1 TRAP transporter small permease subunit [Pseudooceanicola pacificus]
MSALLTLSRRLKRCDDALNAAVTVACVACFVIMLLTVALQILSRYVLASPPFWTEELARWSMVWGGLLGATVAFHEGADPKLYQPPLRRPWVRVAQAVARLAGAWIFLGTVLWFSVPFLARQAQQVSEGLGISPVWVALAVPVSAVVICLHALALALTAPFLPPPINHDPEQDLH